MNNCERIDIRDLLPDFVSGTLSAGESDRVRAHLEACADCAAELSLLRTARAVRPIAPALDVARIVSALPKPGQAAPPVLTLEKSSVAASRHHGVDGSARKPSKTNRWAARGVWRAAATIGVMIVGGWSLLIVRQGGIANVTAGRGDSTQLTDVPSVASPASGARDAKAPTTNADTQVAAASATNNAHVAVSFGGLSDYTDDELQSVLDRLEKWDGATSTETTTTTPILPVKGSETPQE